MPSPRRSSKGLALTADSGSPLMQGVPPRWFQPMKLALLHTSRFKTQALVVVCALAFWFLATSVFHLVGPGRFPSPIDVWVAWQQANANDGYAGALLYQHVLQSCGIILCGFVLAVVTGVPLGLLMGGSKTFGALIGPVFAILRPIPPLAWIPLSILWFGLGSEAKIFVIWLSAFVPSVINSNAGIRNIDRTLIETARVHGASRWFLTKAVIVPAALPMIMTGMRISLQVCWNALVAAELVGSYHGIGHLLNVATLDLYPGMILLAMIIVAVLGKTMTAILAAVERRMFRWSEEAT